MHLHIVKMQADLFSETEHRIAAESALSSQFTSGLQELPAKVVSTFVSEFDRQRSVLELCKKAEREMQENLARLQQEIAGRQVEAASVLQLCKKAESEMR